MTLFVDTETTSLKPGSVAQLAMLKVDGTRISSFNRWFRVPQGSMSAQAAAVNGLTEPTLFELSGGKNFSDVMPEIEEFTAVASN